MVSLKGKVEAAEASQRATETLAAERAHQIATLEREVKVREERVAVLEESEGRRESRMRELESKLALSADKITQLQVEKERLTQQVRDSEPSIKLLLMSGFCTATTL